MKILVVDDSRAMRMIVLRTLREAGFGEHVLLDAPGGAEALRLARASRPELVLADWNMPEMNGLELFRALKAEKLPCRVGFVTSEVSGDARRLVAEGEALFVIGKPFTADDFREALEGVLGPPRTTLPTPEAVGTLLGTLLGRRVSSRRGMPVVFRDHTTAVVGAYQRPDSELCALIAMDAGLANAIGAALGMLPASPAAAMAMLGKLPEHLLENVREALNVCSRLFKCAGGQLSLRGMRVHPPALPTELTALVARPTSRLDLEVEIEAYGRGEMSLYLQ